MASTLVKLGYSGPEVDAIRGALRAQGIVENYTVTSVNLFDTWVDKQIRQFQGEAGLPVTGIVDQKTWSALVQDGAGPPGTVSGGLTVSSDPKKPTLMDPIAIVGNAPKLPIALILGVAGLGLWWWFSRRNAAPSVLSSFAGLMGKSKSRRRSLRRRHH